MASSGDGFSDALAERYDQLAQDPRYCIFTGSVLHYLGLEEGVVGKRVLDVGCGNGDLAADMRRQGASEVVGVDISPAQIALARQRHGGLGTTFRVEDAYQPLALPEAPFDTLVSVFAFHFIQDPEQLARACRNLFEALKPGGLLVWLDITHDYVFDPKRMARLEALTSYCYDPGVAPGQRPAPWSRVAGQVRSGSAWLPVDHVAIPGRTVVETLQRVGFSQVRREPLRFPDAESAWLWGPEGFNHHLLVARR
ncbi:class I SAM-dependent methyltransferase [Halomonas denitrificans]|uniref:class I SAM-dependent methyltransferase n=1 Tax=Halomonas denitrificans TaxID=370769 RepID=UPI001C99DD59|nr:class I SAM-dependent methyltransferase [Halomonas denitrificans]MBY5968231.1 methyltransferase domain-containing protein [Halomonas denitrificans]